MAGALRPVVVLMVVASLLFLLDGWLDGAYPGGKGWVGGTAYGGLAFLAYVFAALNAVIAIVIARGSERTLVARIALSAFFLVERPLTAFALGPKPPEAVAVHLATAFVELVILVGALRVWRLGRSLAEPDLALAFALDAPSPAPPPVADDQTAAMRPSSSRTIALLSLALSGVLAADGLVAGFVPGGRQWGIAPESSGWLVYLFAAAILTVSLPAMSGGRLALRTLFALSLILFLERAFTPLLARVTDAPGLALHAAGAFVALALALAAAAAIRAGSDRSTTLARASAGSV